MERFDRAIKLIDTKNSEDPNKEWVDGEEFPKELIYAKRMSEQLLMFYPEAPETLQIAARAQHICRWKIPRKSYPMDRKGYLRWREDLKKLHAEITIEILEKVGYDDEFIKRTAFLIQKKQLKKDEETQVLEDVICLVFLKYYYGNFAVKHTDEKVIDILRKTWRKMSEKAHEKALKLSFSLKDLNLIQQAIQ